MLGFNQRRLVKEFDMRFDEGSMIRKEDLSINFRMYAMLVRVHKNGGYTAELLEGH